MVIKVTDQNGENQKQIASPFKFSACKPIYNHAGLETGEKTDLVLKKLGYTKDDIENLKKEGVCADNKK